MDQIFNASTFVTLVVDCIKKVLNVLNTIVFRIGTAEVSFLYIILAFLILTFCISLFYKGGRST